jgi:hypothetical protein
MQILKKITVDDKECMMKDIRHGRNTLGGAHGYNDQRTFDSDRNKGGRAAQKYNHSQKSPMIIRGK